MDPAIVINPTLQADVPYDLFKNLQTVSIVSSSPEVLVVSPHLGVKTFQELIAYGKANPGKLNYRLRRHRHHAASRCAKCSTRAPASRPRTFPTRASAHPTPT